MEQTDNKREEVSFSGTNQPQESGNRNVPKVKIPGLIGSGRANESNLAKSPVWSGFVDLFPLAIAAAARVSKVGNKQHALVGPIRWDRSIDDGIDHRDQAFRHLINSEHVDPSTGELHAAAALWRVAAHLQILEELRLSTKDDE